MMKDDKDLNLNALTPALEESDLQATRKLQLELTKSKGRKKKYHKVRLSRSVGGDIVLFIILAAFACFSAYPLIFAICNAFKPISEMFIFPPKLLDRKSVV